MKKISRLLALSLSVLAISFVSVNAQDFSGEIPEAALEREVERQILRLPYYELFDYITYKVEGNTVTLSGKVRNGVNRSDAEGVVKRITGVEKVVNNIEILPPGRNDEVIRRNVARSLANTGNLSRYLWPVNPPVRIVVDRGHVTLEGTVSSQADSNMANIAARSVPGAFSVTNNLVVDSKRAG
ncbi:MAG TPA: BON domain-containing protein [Pyrinomonadaceae bacterium]|nr:BON domain-containing protein [Pyrinomonadaceae bacterium]HMP66346.1 BON domain-containing protein [Pyrinomonadaceae bacterium]